MIKKIAIIGSITLVAACLILTIVDYAKGDDYTSIGIIKDSDYDRAYNTTSCDSKGLNCHTTHHPEVCQVYVKGDEVEDWFEVNCHLYFSPLHINDKINVSWREGGLFGITWDREAYK